VDLSSIFRLTFRPGYIKVNEKEQRMKKTIIFLIITIVCISYSCLSSESPEFPKIERKPPAHVFKRGELKKLPRYDPKVLNLWQVDLRHTDVSRLDLRDQLPSLSNASFDKKTIWPPVKNMPASFQPEKVLEMGKDPGLGVRKLHARGITGRGVSIAIIDPPSLVEHIEYKDRLMLYSEINIEPSCFAQMHGPAVSSVLAGKSIGVAPGVDLYYFAAWPGVWSYKDNKGDFQYDLGFYADALKEVIALNRKLPPGKKIRAVAIMFGFNEKRKGYAAMMEALAMAKKEGIFVISCSSSETHGFKFHGLGRSPFADPNRVDSYCPPAWWEDKFFQGKMEKDLLLFPMDSRTFAGPAGAGDYAFYRNGGLSWVVPYVAGLYALCRQVKKDITPVEFWEKALSTASFTDIRKGDKTYRFGPIVNPVGLIDSFVK
jgi:hypothetical protein